MAGNQSATPNTQSVLASLASAADAARQVYLTALAANPGADLSQLYGAEMQAAAIWSQAQNKALNDDPSVTAAQADLDAVAKAIRNQLSTLKDISTCVSLVGNLVQLAATVAKFMA